MNSPITSRPSTLFCLVCGHPTPNSNLGVDACRACANFFKRTSTLGKNYVCRQSSGKCIIRRDRPFLCRRCRYDKCVSIGMRLPTTSSMEPECSSSLDEVMMAEESSPSIFNNGILRRMATSYNASLERRTQKELALRSINLYDNATLISPEGTKFYICTNDFFYDIFPTVLVEVVATCAEVFPEYSGLESSEQNMMLKSFAGCFFLMEMNYLSEKYFPYIDRYFTMSIRSVSDLKDLKAFMTSIRGDKGDFTRAITFYSEKSFALTRPILREASLTETEFHAILILLVWNFDFTPWMPEHIVEMGERIKERIFDELNWYYKNEMKCDDFAVRLGRLMLLMHAIQEAGVLLQEECQTYRLLGAMKEDDLFVKLIL